MGARQRFRGNLPFRSRFSAAAPFTPAQIPNLALWLDASDTGTISSAGGLVSQWNDKSGNGNNAVQAVGASQPTTGTRTLNGLNTLDFDGTDDRMSLPSSLFPIATGNNTFLIILASDNNIVAAQPIIGFVGTNDSGYTINYGENVGNNMEFKQGGSFAVGGQGFSANAPLILGMRRTGTQLQGIRDGSVIGQSATAADRTLTDLLISRANFNGGGRGIDGLVGEICAFTRSLTDTEINQVGNYLKNKWGGTWANL